MKTINFFGRPGSGKSTSASWVFAMLKRMGLNVEYVTEFAKDKTWEGNMLAISCQPYISGNQIYREEILKDKVDCVVTDSPTINGMFYIEENYPAKKQYIDFLISHFKHKDNINIFIISDGDSYNQSGRNQTFSESVKIEYKIKKTLKEHNIEFSEFKRDECEMMLAYVFENIKELIHEPVEKM